MKKLIVASTLLVLHSPIFAMEEDDPLLFKVMINQLEIRKSDSLDSKAWEINAWLGKDLHKLWLKSEGEREKNEAETTETETETQLLYSRAVKPFWDFQIGAGQDTIPNVKRNYAVIGMKGLAPYLFEVDASLSFGKGSQTKLNLRVEYETMLTQKWVLSPEIELNAYTKDDIEMGVGSGLSNVSLGLRLRYEITREFAPYIGINWGKSFGKTADLVLDDGGETKETQFVAGVRMWF